MPADNEFQSTRGTALVTFGQTGTYSAPAQLNGWLVGCYSDNWPSAAGSLILRAGWSAAGAGYPVQTLDGTALRVLSFGSGTFYTLGHAPWHTVPIQYLTIQIGTAGTAGVAAGGTIVLVTEN